MCNTIEVDNSDAADNNGWNLLTSCLNTQVIAYIELVMNLLKQ